MSASVAPNIANVERDTTLLDSQDESVRIAIRALGDMRAGGGPSHINTSLQPTPALSTASALSSPSVTTPTMDGIPHSPSPDYLVRMSGLPLVSGALRAYEHGKNSSRVVKYGAEMMESSISTISRPVIDRLGIGGRPSPQSPATPYLDRGRAPSAETSAQTSRDPSLSNTDDDRRARADAWVEERRTSHDRSRTPQPPTPLDDGTSGSAQPPQEVVRRPRWQTMLLEAGGISAAISDDNMRRLKFCLQWLQYATSHIDAQILILRDFITSLNPNAPVSASHIRTLNDLKRDVVGTVREAVAVVSKYAGGALPEPARNTVRSFILHLPQRWARAAAPILAQPVAHSHRPAPEHAVGSSATSSSSSSRRAAHANTPYSRPASPTAGTSPTSPRHGRNAPGSASVLGVSSSSSSSALSTVAAPSAGATTQAAQRILTLATESLDMMRGVTGVVKDSLDRADMWLDRLRMVGIQRQQPDGLDEAIAAGAIGLSSVGSTPTAAQTSFATPTPRRGSMDVMARAPSLACSSAPSYTESPMSSRPPTPGSSVGCAGQLPDFRTLTLSSRYTSPLVETTALPLVVKVKEESGMEVDA